jgi:hypothetical protein
VMEKLGKSARRAADMHGRLIISLVVRFAP